MLGLHPMIQLLMPEITLVLGATLILLTGLSKELSRRAALFSLATIGVALWFAFRASAGEIDTSGVTALHDGPLVWFARTITLAVGALIVMVNRHVPDEGERAEFFALLMFSLAGVSLVPMANSLVMLFLALELVSVPTYILIGLSRRDIHAQESAGKYFFLGAFAAAITLYGFSFLYGFAGTMTLFGPDSIAVKFHDLGGMRDKLALFGLLLSIAGLGLKVAAVPFHFYVADVYQGAASPVTGLLGFVPKFAGFLALINILTLTGWTFGNAIFWLLWILAALTMTVGNTLALMQHNVKRMLAYSSVAHSGYMLVALAAGPKLFSGGREPLRDGIAALLFYMAAYGVMNLGCFAAFSFFRKPGDDDPDDSIETLDELAGSAREHPWATLGLALCVLGLMGFPLTGGFIGKFYIISSALSADGAAPAFANVSAHSGAMLALVIILALNAAVAAAYYLRILAACYLRKPTAGVTPSRCHALQLSLAICAILAVAIFIRPGVLYSYSRGAAQAVASTAIAPAAVATGDVAPTASPAEKSAPVMSMTQVGE